ncbi:transposase, partial [Photobacterium lutimaris]|uniref:transposase n=1 Tax=Photobacterium lutimaris TaxID=388278 RepID=UPI0010D0A41E
RNGLQFFYRYTLSKQWIWLNIVKPPQVKRLPDLLTPDEVGLLITMTRQSRYLYRGVLPDKDIIKFNDHQVTFRYTDSQTQRPATRTLPVVQFLWLILPTWQLPEQTKPQKAKRDCPCCQHTMRCVGATRPR